jgi:hypothetical protein
VFPDYPAAVVRNAGAERELAMMRWGVPPPPKFGGPELKFMATIVSKLRDELVALCRTSFASIEPMLSDWSDRGFSILKVKD